MTKPRGSVLPALLFLGVGLSWGASFLFIRVAVMGVSPVQLVLIRTVIATVVLVGVMLALRRPWLRGFTAWKRITLLAVFGCVIPFLLYAWAAQRIPSGLSSIYNASVPIATALVTFAALRQEKLGARKLVGLLLGATGIVVVLAPWQLAEGGGFDVPGQVACIGAVLGLGFAFSYTRKAISPLGLDPIAVAMGQMFIGAIIMGIIAPFTAMTPVSLNAPVVLSILVLGVLCTGFAYVWNFRVIDEWGAASASMVTYVTTLVGIVLGVFVLGETVTLYQILGGVVVLAGVALGVTAPKPPAASPRL